MNMKELKCETCSFKFEQRSQLNYPIRAVHARLLTYPRPRPQSPKRKVEKVVTCLICNKTFARKTNLKNHIELVHEKLKRVACNVCGFKFGHIGDLRVHINIVHNKILRFECGKCDRKCVSKNDLKKHVANVHEKPKEAVIDCGLCEEKFVSKAEAERHRRSVHDTRKYACTLCRKKLVKNKFKCTR